MLYAATRQPLYLGAGVLLGCGAGVLAYKLFKHVRIRVMVWKDPFANWNYGYQVGQALFAIGTGGWFGMVERIEGFCSEEDWKRAYKEINEMEASWVKEGAIVLKFWLHIDKDEQERRFRERMDTPSKQWKITDEDWRNREKWDQYLEAVNEMIFRTSKETAPWIIVEGDCKYYARIKVMLTAIDSVNADHIFIFPNNKNIVLAANQAKTLTKDKDIIVIPTKNIPQGITAIINYVAEKDIDSNEELMLDAIKSVQTGQVTYAVRDTQIDGKEIHGEGITGHK